MAWRCAAARLVRGGGRPKTRGRCPNWWLPCITTVQDGMVVENTTSQQVMDVRKALWKCCSSTTR
jgi:NADH-quinone oxidoreductase subunit G